MYSIQLYSVELIRILSFLSYNTLKNEQASKIKKNKFISGQTLIIQSKQKKV